MPNSMKALCLLILGLGCLTSLAREYEGSRENSILLNGQWEFARGDGSEHAESPAGQRKLDWQQVTLPGPFMKWNQEVANQTKFVWVRRSFDVTRDQAESMAVLRWNRIAYGAAAFINGQKVGENEPTGPYQVIVPAGVLRPGENQIVLKIRGAAGVRQEPERQCTDSGGFRCRDAGGDRRRVDRLRRHGVHEMGAGDAGSGRQPGEDPCHADRHRTPGRSEDPRRGETLAGRGR